MTADLPFFQIDAFADRPFQGNSAAVMPLDAWLDDATLQGIAMENNLSETAFIIPDSSGEADYELRWFTPATEVEMCGHATLASGHHVLSREPAMAEVRFRTRHVGVLIVGRLGDKLRLDLPAWLSAPVDGAALAAAFGAAPEAVYRTTDAAEPSLMAVFSDATTVRSLAPDFRAVAALGGVLAMATAPGDDGVDMVSRVFAPAAGIDEDPVTGSAHAMMVPYWAERLGRNSFTAFQASKRGGAIDCTLAGDRVLLDGRCVTVIEGIFRI
ncbi:PhzF family phenazine biosynthesis protein [Sphingoaurantiacus capsulatus]|uniref:PhzF family phenazine biosynthesis protein n=1 Tax=Sphingoaurantiacus capsulatus TaxID=1771310 RepID=A0ABV7X6X5_9SPHN